ncbi:pirin family protein [Hyphococcus sp.]|uniref:pirin family protein n=1 Tax=Hyphococcus sp. TaxID=2038636 RepID=UPI002087B9C3|nr:MAG: quercetin 2,3-dioxygenase [Marinicaulis sp.]
MKKIKEIRQAPSGHWVGDGFPVRSLVSYDRLGQQISPFLLFDYAGPHNFEPAQRPRGVGEHPHRGFETVTIVYDGEVAHRDSTGKGGVIGPGDVQWMTAAAGILHEEFHSPGYTKTGGPFRMVQLWVNLPAKDKMSPPGYQAILSTDIPSVDLPNGAGRVRIIAGSFSGANGPARTFTPINLWDMRLTAGASSEIDLPEGHTAIIAVLSGAVTIGDKTVTEAETVVFEREGSRISLEAEGDSTLLVMTGEPIDEPVVGAGPFVMNTEAEIKQAFEDFRSGHFGSVH